MGSPKCGSVLYKTSKFNMMKLVLVIFVTIMVISRVASNPVNQPREPRAFSGQIIGDIGNLCQGGASGSCNGEQVGAIGNGAIKPSSIDQVGNLCQGGESGTCTGAQNGRHHGKKRLLSHAHNPGNQEQMHLQTKKLEMLETHVKVEQVVPVMVNKLEQ